MRHHQRRSYSEVTAPYQWERSQLLQRTAGAVLGTVDVRIDKSSTGVLTPRGATLDPPTVMEDTLLGKCGDAVEVLRSSRRLGLSVQQTMRYPRHCRWQDVANMRGQLTAYHAQRLVGKPAEGRPRVAGAATLRDVVMSCLEPAQATGEFEMPSCGEIPLVLCLDATPLWRTSATRCDVCVG